MTAKLFYFFKTFLSNGIIEGIKKGLDNRKIRWKQTKIFEIYFPKETWPKNDFHIRYSVDDTYLAIEKKTENSLSFDYSESVRKLIQKGKEILNETGRIVDASNKLSFWDRIMIDFDAQDKFLNYLREQLMFSSPYKQYYIPAGRVFFAFLQKNIFSFIKHIGTEAIDPFLLEFANLYEKIKMHPDSLINPQTGEDYSDQYLEKYQNYFEKVLNSKHKEEKGIDYLFHPDARKVSLLNASSGQQELLPLLLTLRYFANTRNGKGVTIYIEEPEAHLFPTAQKNIVELMAEIFNLPDIDIQFIITTHSPYILSSFNNLMQAGALSRDANNGVLEKLEKIVPKSRHLDPKAVRVYSLKKGIKTDLIDPELELINVNVLDEVSNEISIEFGQLLDME